MKETFPGSILLQKPPNVIKEHNSPSSQRNLIARKFSRRHFLNAAGVTALALPFIRPWSVLGQDTATDPNSPNPWLMRGCNVDAIPGMIQANIPITGVRHYCATNTVPSVWPAPPGVVHQGSNSEGTCSWPASDVTIPNVGDVSMCVTIYPLVNKLLKTKNTAYENTTGYDDELHSLLSTTQAREMLSCWHEASNITDGTPGKVDGDNVKITPDLARAMQTYLYNFAKTGDGSTPPSAYQIQNPAYKCTVGAVEIGGWVSAAPWMAPGLDFYGMDLYHKNFSDPTVPLEDWREHVYGTPNLAAHSPNATIAVCECNCDCDGDRAYYFYQAANWVWNQTNRGARSFLCFWNGSGGMGGCWPPGQAAQDELRKIGNGDYSIGNLTPNPSPLCPN